MKHPLLTATAAALITALVSDASAQTQLGYTTGNMGRTTVFHYGNTAKQGMAIRLSHEKLQQIKGQQIKAIYTAFGSANAVKDKQANLFIATTLEGQPAVEQTHTIGSANRWETINLDTPYTISGDEEELLVGYTLTASSDNIPEALQADMTNNLAGCCYAWASDHWADLYGTGFGAPNLRIVLGSTIELTDVALTPADYSTGYYKACQPYQSSASIYNFGTTAITSIDVTVITGSEQRTLTYDGLNVKQYGTYSFDMPELRANESGFVPIKAHVKVNNATDSEVSDNAFETNAFFYPSNMERNILVEEFTGMQCGNCPAGARGLQQVIDESDIPCIEIMHHSGYSPDFFSTDADYDYTIYYGEDGTFAPAVMFNRLTVPGVSDVPVTRIGNTPNHTSLSYAATRQPYVSLGLTSNYDEQSREATVTLSILAHRELSGATLLNVFLVQDSIIGYQANGGANYVHNGVTRQVLTGNSWGALLPESFGPGEPMTWNATFTLPEAIYSDFWTPALLQEMGYKESQVTIATDAPHMRIVAYVANYDDKDINNNVVHNCIEVPLMGGSYTQGGMEATENLETISSDSSQTGVQTYDLSGRRLVDMRQLSTGLYIINGKKTWICR